jgi:hypothetical protein
MRNPIARLARKKQLPGVEEPGTEEAVIGLAPRRAEYAGEASFEVKGPKKETGRSMPRQRNPADEGETT